MSAHQKPIRCVLIQLGRISDLLESLLAIRAAQQLYPTLEITIVCKKEAAAFAERAEWVKAVAAAPVNDWITEVNSASFTPKELMGPVARWISPLIGKGPSGSEPWDILINWSYSESSSYIAGLLPAKLKLGYQRRSNLDFSSGDAWSQYIHGAVQSSLDPGIHLTDILTTQLLTALQVQFGDPLDVGSQSATGREFFSIRTTQGDPILDPSRIWIGIQIDSFFNVAEWTKLIKLTLERHPEAQIALLGAEAQRELGADILRSCHHQGLDSRPDARAGARRIITLVGETDAELWIDVLSQCKWVISSSPRPAQLASLLGTRVLQLSNSKNPSWVQAAYGNQHLLLSTTDEKVKLVPEAVYAAWSYAQYEKLHQHNWDFAKHLDRLGFATLTEWIDLKKSRIRPSEEGGGVAYEREMSRPMSSQEWTALVHAQIARLWYCGWTPPVGSELDRSLIRPELIQAMRALEESSGVMTRVLGEAVKTAEQFHSKSAGLKSDKLMSVNDRQELESQGRRLLELQKLVERLANADEHLLLFSTMLTVMLHNLEGNQISEISKETLITFKQLEQGAQLLRSWVTHTLKLARPAVVEPLSFIPIP